MKKRPLHSRAIKEVERQKKDFKRELNLARKSGTPAEVVHSLATHCISLVRAHSKLKKASNARLLTREVKAARGRCHRDFRQCAREILDGGLGQVEPSFGDEAAGAITGFQQRRCLMELSAREKCFGHAHFHTPRH